MFNAARRITDQILNQLCFRFTHSPLERMSQTVNWLVRPLQEQLRNQVIVQIQDQTIDLILENYV